MKEEERKKDEGGRSQAKFRPREPRALSPLFGSGGGAAPHHRTRDRQCSGATRASCLARGWQPAGSIAG